jgi:C-terminal processing protease CtpA/Prc
MRETFGLLVLLLDALDARESPLAARDRERNLDAAGTGFVVRDAPGAEGVFVEALAPGAPERRAGLRPGDRLLRLGDEPIRGLRQLEPMLLTLHRGQTVTLALERKVDGVAHRLDLAVDY